MSEPVLNPQIPYVAPVEGGLHPGKMLKVVGRTQPGCVLFAINYQLGPNLNPRDDIALHVSPRFPNGFITRNHIENMTWGPEENAGPMWIKPGQEFEILILCEAHCYKIAVNGRHFAEFRHRLPFQKVTHLVIDGDVEVESVINEIVPVDVPNPMADAPEVPNPNFGPPPPGGLYPTIQPPSGPMPPPPGSMPPPPGPYGPPPPNSGYYNPQTHGYQPGYEKPEEEDTFSGCLDKVGLALGGLVAAGGIAAAAHAMSKKREEDPEKDHEKSDANKSKTESEGGLGSLGSIGTALATSLVSNVLNNSHAQHGYPPPPSSSPGGDVLGSILGAFGGGAAQHPQPQSGDSLSGALGLISGVFGGGGHPQSNYQPSGGYGQYQPSGGYQSGGSNGSDLLSSIGSSLFSSAMEGLNKHNKDKPRPSRNTTPPSEKPATPSADNSSTGPGRNLTADEISKGLGLDN
ncbi:basic salivary proline-rich protein 1-like isoform X2 [Ceratina calcarata]|uniref:Galectin n=1 Tax=Ceratina calcarata TaxID=156304 RepID=A0AAJ7J6C4_9HYME|nr:basic salivary proline-rich protein 1-like isoform X2 [Ceratina calcarata]